MANFHVEYTERAEGELADIWSSSKDRTVVAMSSYMIECALADDPLENGRALSEGLMRITEDPLAYYFSVDLSSATVFITDVRSLLSTP